MHRNFTVVIYFIFSVLTGINCKSWTVCKTYDNPSNVGTCSGQTIYVENQVATSQPEDYVTKSQLNTTVEENVRTYVTDIQNQLNMLHKKVAKYEASLNKTADSCDGGLIYGNECIKLPYTKGPAVQFQSAQLFCANINSNLTEIYDDAMYHRVYQFIKSTWIVQTNTENTSFIYVWLGMTFQQPLTNSANEITLRNGTKILMNVWQVDYPSKKTSKWTLMGMTVETNRNNSVQGIWNWYENKENIAVPLCSYKIN